MYFPRLNLVVFLVAALFFYEQNTYWGWNFMPESERELITDGFNLILLAMAWMSPRHTETKISPPKFSDAEK